MIFEVKVRVEVDDDLGLVGAAKMVRERLSTMNVEVLGLARVTDDDAKDDQDLSISANTEV
jgi:hypothetical protein